VYNETTSHLVSQVLDRKSNSVLLCYGQSLGGKSSTVIGNNNFDLEKNSTSHLTDAKDTRGLIVRAAHDIFNRGALDV
jgi:hypothetical protein